MSVRNSAHLYLVDASPYIFRAWFSIPASVKDPAGRSVNAIYGFANVLLQLLAREDLTHVAITFDESLTTSFRNEFYPEYKAQRELPPAELEGQIKDCQSIAAALGAATYVSARFEADDLIATLHRTMKSSVARFTIVSGDKDLAQLVDERTTLLDLAKERLYGPEEVKETFGVTPAQIVDLLALQGDAVDNIPGVQGIGRKTAQTLLQRFGDLDRLYREIDTLGSLGLRGADALMQRLRVGKEQAYLSRRLATLAADAPVQTTLGSLQYLGALASEIDPLFERLGFHRIRSRIPRWKH